MKIKNVSSLNGYVVEWSEPGNYLISRRNELFRCTEIGGPMEHIGTIDAPLWKAMASRSRLAQRLLRFMVSNVIPLPNGELFITFDRSVGVMADGRYRELEGLERPCRVLRSAAALAPDGSVFFGEYLDNAERGEMRIYRYVPGSRGLDVVYKFGKGEIRHIHGIYHDQYSDSLFCLTGDHGKECRMLKTRDGFSSMEDLGGGDESWRAVSMLFTEEAIYYGTDAEYQENEIFRLDRASGERRSLGKVSGTVFYSRKLDGPLLFGTTAENAPAQKENVAAIYMIGHDEKLIEIAKYKKDRWHRSLFQFGTLAFSNPIEARNKLYFSLVATVDDNLVYEITFPNG